MNGQGIKCHRSRVPFVAICIIIALVFVSCREKETFFKFEQLKDAKWQQTDTLEFYVDSTHIDITKFYRVSVEVTNGSNYPYSNLWLSIEYTGQQVNSIQYNLSKEIILADNLGKWSGAGFGSLYQSSLLLGDSVVFPIKQDYKFTIIHTMQDNPLKGIERVGLKIIENK